MSKKNQTGGTTTLTAGDAIFYKQLDVLRRKSLSHLIIDVPIWFIF